MSNYGTLIRLREPKLYFDNVNIESVTQVEDSQHFVSQEITKLKGKLLALALATPKDITPNDEDSPVDFVTERVNELFGDLSDTMFDSFSLDIIERIIDDWKYSYPDSKEIYENCETDEDTNSKAFPKDEHEEIKRDLDKFTFAPPDDNVEDALQRSVRNLYLNDKLSDFITNKYIIIMNDKIYSDYDGQFIFKTKEAAEEVLKKKFDFHTYDYISKEFIEAHPEFFKSVIRLMEFLNYDKEYIDKFDNALNIFINNDYKFDKDNLETIYESLNKVVYERLYDICGIKILKISELIK